MKITAFFLFVAAFQVSGKGYAQQVTLNLRNVNFYQVLTSIKDQTGLGFVFSDSKKVDFNKKFDVVVQGVSVAEVLKICFQYQKSPLGYQIHDAVIWITPSSERKSQEGQKESLSPVGTVLIKVTDSLGNPLNGAFVQEEQSKKVVTTDETGTASLVGVDMNGVVNISFVGYKTRKIELGGHSELTVRMDVTSKELGQVTVGYSNGYNNVSATTTPGNFSIVDNKLFNQRVTTNVLDRLEGNVPGLIFNKNSYAASATGQTDISIQGHSTLFSNDQPLIVVDNFPYDGDINNINPNDVESVTILKDAVAASIWGVRSGNGVIVITTKHGRKNQKVMIDVNANFTIGGKPDLYYSPNYLGSNDYINIVQDLFSQGYYDGYLSSPYTLVSPVVDILARQRAGLISDADATSQINSLRNQDVRHDLSKYLYQNSLQQQYAIDMHGGGQNSDYFFSFGFDQGKSFLVGNSNNRTTINSNYNIYPTKNLQISLGFNYIQSNSINNNQVGILGQVDPYTKLVDASGNSLNVAKDYSPAYLDSLTNIGYLNWRYDPIKELKFADNRSRQLDNRINIGIKNNFRYGLSAEVRYQYERQTGEINNYYSDSTYSTRNLINLYTQGNPGSFTYPVPIGGILNYSNNYLTSHQVRGQIDLLHSWSSIHQIAAVAGAEIRTAITESNANIAYGYDKSTQNSIPTIDYSDYFPIFQGNGSNRIPNNSGFSKTTNNFVSYFSNAAYIFKGIYSFSISGRIDHSNLFGVSTNQKAVPLYSAGLAWNISKQSFYNIDWLPNLKIRSTFGYNANINTSATAITTISQSTNSALNGLNYSFIANPGNPLLQWEKVRKINFGIDLGSKNDRLLLTFDYYLKRGINLFGSSPLAPSTGLSSFFGNTADTKGSGYDIIVNTRNLITKGFEWTSNFMFSRAFDRVTKYDVPAVVSQYLSGGQNSAQAITPIVGQNIFAVFSYRSAGLTHDTGDPQGYVNGKPSTDYTSIIQNATFDSLQYNGSSRPLYFGSLRNTFTYKHISLSINIIYKFDYVFRKSGMSSYAGIGFATGGGTSDYFKRWQKPGDELHTTVPSFQYPPFTSDRINFYNYTSSLVDKGDNIKISDISLRYDIDKNWLKVLFINHIQVYFTCTNIGILWRANKDHLDPDIYSGATFMYPTPKNYSFGVKATL